MSGTVQVMTLADAEAAIKEWQNQLQTAKAAVAAYEQQLGQLALTGGVGSTTRELARLRDEVTIAEQALAAAQRQREAVKNTERTQRIEQLRADAAELDAKANEAALLYNELAPQAKRAHQQMEDFSRRALSMQRQADELERRLREAVK